MRSMRPSTNAAKPIAIWIETRHLPKTCDSGSQSRWLSDASRMPRWSTAAASYVQQPWVSSTPFGRPVVPEV